MVQTFELRKRTVHFPLHPGLGPQGKALTDLLRGYDLDAAHRRLGQLAAAEGLPFVPPGRAWDSRLAQELAVWAAERGTSLDAALFRAVWAEQRNIGDVDVLVAIAAESGLDAAAAREALDTRSARARVDADWSFARQVGVTGVPTYAIAGRGVVGAQPDAVLVQLAEAAGVRRRPEA